MPRYAYVALDVDGRKRSGGVDARDEHAARADLSRRKLLPVQLVAQGRGARGRSEEARQARRGASLSHKARLVVTRQLATLVEAAVPVDEALAMIAAQQERAEARTIVENVRASVMEGARLADALGRHPKSFPALYRAAVAGGERSGQLGFVLARLADYLARAHALRTKMTTALIYPAALTCVALTVVVSLMIFVVPSLAEQFQSFEARLPLLTQILIGISEFLVNFWALLLAGLITGFFFARAALSREAVRKRLDAFALRAPLIGRWARSVNASRFIRAVATLTASGLPVLEAVRAAQDASGNRAAAEVFARMGDEIEEGEALSGAMRRSALVPPMASYMAQSGENAGDLSGMLTRAADHLDQEFEAVTDSAISLFEPAIIVFMGAIVALIVLSIMLPVLQLNQLAIG